MKIKCKNCQEIFEAENKYKYRARKYCSVKCYRDYQRKGNYGWYSGQGKKNK